MFPLNGLLACFCLTSVITALTTDVYLTNYWPILSGTMQDVAGNAHMTQGASTNFVADRCGNPSAALNFNGGYTTVPSGVYFKSAFSVSTLDLPARG